MRSDYVLCYFWLKLTIRLRLVQEHRRRFHDLPVRSERYGHSPWHLAVPPEFTRAGIYRKGR